MKNPSLRGLASPSSISFLNFSAILLASQFIHPHMSTSLYTLLLVILMSFHPPKTMLKSQFLHWVNNHSNDIHIITVLTMAGVNRTGQYIISLVVSSMHFSKSWLSTWLKVT
jgi:hypothetical protein